MSCSKAAWSSAFVQRRKPGAHINNVIPSWLEKELRWVKNGTKAKVLASSKAGRCSAATCLSVSCPIRIPYSYLQAFTEPPASCKLLIIRTYVGSHHDDLGLEVR